MKWRFITPNKPIRVDDSFLNEIDDKYVADVKFDGWRIEIYKSNDKLNFVSRRNTKYELPVQLIKMFHNLPEGMSLDAEWLNKTRIKAINSEFKCSLPLIDNIVIFDVRWFNGRFISNISLQDRRKIEYYNNLPKANLETILESNFAIFKTISCKGSMIKQLYNKQKRHMISEGIVIKRLDGGLNSNWYKMKYRR